MNKERISSFVKFDEFIITKAWIKTL
jgi:hypothetical protein